MTHTKHKTSQLSINTYCAILCLYLILNCEKQKEMNKERHNEFINEIYEFYLSKASRQSTEDLFYAALSGNEIIDGMLDSHTRNFIPYSKEEFIDKIKTDSEFSERWGLKIQKRELNLEERVRIIMDTEHYIKYTDKQWKEYMGTVKIPKRVIIFEYKDEKSEFYE